MASFKKQQSRMSGLMLGADKSPKRVQSFYEYQTVLCALSAQHITEWKHEFDFSSQFILFLFLEGCGREKRWEQTLSWHKGTM